MRQVTRQFVLTSPPPIKPQDRLLAKLAPADGTEGHARVSIDTTVRNAVSLLLDTKADRLLVEGPGGEVVGAFRFSDAGALL